MCKGGGGGQRKRGKEWKDPQRRETSQGKTDKVGVGSLGELLFGGLSQSVVYEVVSKQGRRERRDDARGHRVSRSGGQRGGRGLGDADLATTNW